MNSVLVTGGFGYLGGRLAQHLVRSGGKHVILGTRRLRSSPDWLTTAAVVETPWHSDEALDRLCDGVHSIVHLAGMNAQESAADPVRALKVNGLATARLVRAAVRAGVKRFIYVSTAHVYGSPLRGSISERSCTVSLHPYATTHRSGEDSVLYACKQRAVEGVVIRLSNAFGPPAHQQADCWMLLVNDLCRQAVSTRRMVLRTSGMQRRDFVPLTDACRAIAHLLDLDGGLLDDGPYNMGGCWAPTVYEMTERIAVCCERTFGYRPEIARPQPGPGDVADEFDYRIDKLLDTGFILAGDVDAEIIGTLRFCAAANAA